MKQDKVNKQIKQWIHFKKTCGFFPAIFKYHHQVTEY